MQSKRRLSHGRSIQNIYSASNGKKDSGDDEILESLVKTANPQRRLSHGQSVQNIYSASNGYGGERKKSTDDEEILESLVKTATAKPLNSEQKMRRTKMVRYGDRKSRKRLHFMLIFQIVYRCPTRPLIRSFLL